MAVVIVDTETRIREFLPQLDELITEGLVTLDHCEVIHYVGRDATQGAGQGKTGTKGKKSL